MYILLFIAPLTAYTVFDWRLSGSGFSDNIMLKLGGEPKRDQFDIRVDLVIPSEISFLTDEVNVYANIFIFQKFCFNKISF